MTPAPPADNPFGASGEYHKIELGFRGAKSKSQKGKGVKKGRKKTYYSREYDCDSVSSEAASGATTDYSTDYSIDCSVDVSGYASTVDDEGDIDSESEQCPPSRRTIA
ncbi:uncharacterized protein DFL_005404 [Arthrobotrys flagrans]|uniref:Uncharacterized protein n=1 Tax=Arthrobotrys flagrans TaxID=97331 RepID=A0A437A7K1_ARTFL|nr:hypothetical protein DFL_005404 [Arthrobotrys flagrans]